MTTLVLCLSRLLCCKQVDAMLFESLAWWLLFIRYAKNVQGGICFKHLDSCKACNSHFSQFNEDQMLKGIIRAFASKTLDDAW